jgi:hypothetical protein
MALRDFLQIPNALANLKVRLDVTQNMLKSQTDQLQSMMNDIHSLAKAISEREPEPDSKEPVARSRMSWPRLKQTLESEEYKRAEELKTELAEELKNAQFDPFDPNAK